MKSVMVEETQNAREDVFNDYLIYYQQVWPQGNLSLCQETEKAKRFLLAECDPDSRFTVFDFYQTVSECLTGGRRDCRDVLKELVKATELLEILCVNLFLFPWKKEIKTLKTFTGPFVYWIKPVVPQNMVKGILESIGYRPETDTEYKLDKSADPERATRMGFELFLARQECEYLLEVMGQNGPWECAEILQLRYPRAPQSLYGANESVGAETGEEPASAGRESTSLQVNGEEELDSGHSLLDPEEEVVPEEGQALAGTAGGGDEDSAASPRRLDFQPRDEAAEPRDLLPDDRSILEMRENYPDLAIRQMPIFREPQGRPEKQEKGRRTPKGGAVAFGDQGASASAGRLSESRPVTGVTVPSPKLKRCPPDARAEDKDSAPAEARHAETPAPPQGPRGAQAAPENSQGSADESLVSELAEKMGKMAVTDCRADQKRPADADLKYPADADLKYPADADLKYPVEETAWQDNRGRRGDGKAAPLGSPRDEAQPIMCHPSQVSLCSISGCRNCERPSVPAADGSACDTIKEPPRSFYIPASAYGAPQPGDDVDDQEYVMV